MTETEEKNPVLKPTNKNFTFADGWMIELEENSMKLKVTHKSNHFMFRTWAGINAENVFNTWKNEKPEDLALVLNSVKVLMEYSLVDMELMSRLILTFNQYYTEKQTPATDEEHEAALEEVKTEFEEREKFVSGEVENQSSVTV